MTSDEALEMQLTDVIDELITLVHETKQAEWSASSSPRRDELDDLMEFLRAQVVAISDADEQLTGRPPSILSPSARRQRNLAAEAGGDTGRLVELLASDLDAVARDVRDRARSLDESWSDRLSELADGLERSSATLREG